MRIKARREITRVVARIIAALAPLVPIVADLVQAQDQEPILDAAFEVASFKRNVSGGNVVWRPQATGEFTLINIPFATLLYGAYQLQPYQLIGAPAWVRNENYDILAKLDPKIAGRLQPDGSRYKVPQMGWNQVWQTQPHALWAGVPDGSYFYFVHSFYARPSDARHSLGEADYGTRFTAAIGRDNIFATQFHPEKSADQGLALYRNFLHWNP